MSNIMPANRAMENATMSETGERLKSELSRLSASERAELAHFLIQSLDQQVDGDAESAWDAELARRIGEIRTGTAEGEPASSVFTELREKHT